MSAAASGEARKRIAFAAASACPALAGTAALSVVGPLVFGRRSPFSLF
jgi:hypothetical protein